MIQEQVFKHSHHFMSGRLCQTHRLSDHLVTSVVPNAGSTAYRSVTEKQDLC